MILWECEFLHVSEAYLQTWSVTHEEGKGTGRRRQEVGSVFLWVLPAYLPEEGNV